MHPVVSVISKDSFSVVESLMRMMLTFGIEKQMRCILRKQTNKKQTIKKTNKKQTNKQNKQNNNKPSNIFA